MHAAGAFGRMNLASDHGLDKLAANVRAATTTSASDRAKQIFVQAWSVFSAFCFLCIFISDPPVLGSLQTMPLTLMGMFPGKASTSLIEESVINMEFLT